MGNRKGEFPKTVKRAILARCKGNCEICGVKTTRGNRHYHHISPIAFTHQYYPQIYNYHLSRSYNGLCLCQTCHIRLHSKLTITDAHVAASRLLKLQQGEISIAQLMAKIFIQPAEIAQQLKFNLS